MLNATISLVKDTSRNSIFLFNADIQPLHECFWLVTKLDTPTYTDSVTGETKGSFFDRMISKLERMPVKATCYG